MTVPLITNIAPADGSIAAVGAKSRFSVRDAISEINRAELQLYRGTGPIFYSGGALPETLKGPPTFYFEALSGSPGVYADRTVLVDNFLRISKSVPAQNQEAVYLMGGLEAPAEPDAPLMAEFTLRLNKTEVTVDGNFFTGVLVGLLIGNTGLTVKFFTNAGVQSVQIHNAGLSTTTPPSGAYISSFDWDEAVAQNPNGSNTYKVLWHPQRNLVKLYVKDPDQVSDQLLVTGAVTDFPTIPVPEQRAHQPWLFFGHGSYPAQTSISEWKDVYLFNIVSNPIRDGIPTGGFRTGILTNNPVYLDGESLARSAERPWQILPASFGTIGGGERVTQDGLILERSSLTESIGFFRAEPRVTGRTVLDFRISGEVLHQEPFVETSGMEVYVDDGTRQARFALLQDSAGSQYVGILKDSVNPASIISYEAEVLGFTTERNYRLVLTPGLKAELFYLVATDEGVIEIPALEVPYSLLPLTGLPGPGLGFLHNANSGAARARMTVRQIRYVTGTEVSNWENFVSPTPTWTKVGAGTLRPTTESDDTNIGAAASITESLGVVTVSGLSNMSSESVGNYLEVLTGDDPGIYRISTFVDINTVRITNPAASGADSGNPNIQWREIIDPSFVRVSDSTSSDNTHLKKEYLSGLQSDNGWSLEVRARVVSYTHDAALTAYLADGLNPIRASTGFMFHVLDGSFRTAIIFADAGPPYGKIVFISTYENAHDQLFAIRAKVSAVVDTYYSVDWTKFHLYRLEKIIGGKIRLFVDEADTPALEFDELSFDYPPHVGGGNPRVEMGHKESGILSVSDIQLVKFAISDGYDVSCEEVIDEEELLTRFKYGTNIIVEAEDF